jgi:SpoVK/Ycf46/Vps4 family AAA+-type ATPase
VFDDYRREVERSKVAPILLSNEADGVFASRKENGYSDVDQTENAIQNIILQELEVLNGILIATTNLTKNLDKAFERRFLYKIEFHKPCKEAKKNIWKDKIVKLNNKEAELLSGKYDLSGGQIDNIAKKYLMKVILENAKPDLAEIEAYCSEENSLTKQNKIGF